MEKFEFGAWYPIDSAPRNGEKFVGFNEHMDEELLYVCYWNDYHPESINGMKYARGEGRRGEFYSVWESDFYNTAMPVKPTHWMPIPKLPKETTNA